jgi:DNA repair protein RadC
MNLSLQDLQAEAAATGFFAGNAGQGHPSERVKAKLSSSQALQQKGFKANAAAVVFSHKHPSGVAEPSRADEMITRRLKEALALVDVRVLDHFVVSGGESASFAERGLL